MDEIEKTAERGKQFLRLAWELDDFAAGKGAHLSGPGVTVDNHVKAFARETADKCRALHREWCGVVGA